MSEKISLKNGDVVLHRERVWVVVEDRDATDGEGGVRSLEPVDGFDVVSASRVVFVSSRHLLFPCPAAGGVAVLEETQSGIGVWMGSLEPSRLGVRFRVEFVVEELREQPGPTMYSLRASQQQGKQQGHVFVAVSAELDPDGLAKWFLRMQRWFD